MARKAKNNVRLLFLNHLQNAVQSLRSTRTRTILTTVGITIGVASITAIMALSGGVVQLMRAQVSDLEGNVAVVRPSVTEDTDLARSLSTGTFHTSTLTEKDVADIAAIKGVKQVAPLMSIHSTLRVNKAAVQGTLLATTPSLEHIAKLPIRDGQFIDSVTNADTAVIGTQLAVDLFGTDMPIGQRFTVRGQQFTVIGVIKRMNQPINFNDIDFDNTAIISLEAGKTFHQGMAQIQQINVQADHSRNLSIVTDHIAQRLEKSHRETDFRVLTGDAITGSTGRLFMAIAVIMTAIAAISLLVGGIGIMNIMLVGVAERTREIGLRKSVGASNGHIVGQFLIEALMMSLAGGLAGYILGYAVAFAISTLTIFSPAFTWDVAGAALVTSLGTGVIFGLYPALRAARKHPIEALRQYH